MSSQGTQSNINGRVLEDAAFEIVLRKHPSAKRQVVSGSTIYGETRRVDIAVGNILHIECKHQSVRGSIDEKLPFLVATIKASKVYTVIVISGDGWKGGAIDWLKAQQTSKLVVTDINNLHRYI